MDSIKNIFYAHSSRDNEVMNTYLDTYDKLIEYVNIYDYENNMGANNIGKILFKQINDCEY